MLCHLIQSVESHHFFVLRCFLTTRVDRRSENASLVLVYC